MSSRPSSSATDRPATADTQVRPRPSGGESWPDTDHAALASLRNGSPAEQEATLRRIFSAYSPPLRRYIRHHWPLLPQAEIDDLTAEFLTRCLSGEKPHFLTYDPDRSNAPTRLRTYLCSILDNFLRNHRRSTQAKVRGGDRHFETLDTIRPAAHQETPADDSLTPPGVDTEAYDRHWAQHILSVSFLALEQGTPATREWLPILRPWILADPGDATLKEVALTHDCTHAAIRTHLHRLRKAWRQAVRHAVAQTVAHPDEVDDELRHLAAVLARHPVE